VTASSTEVEFDKTFHVEISHMAETVRKLDSRRRAIFPDCVAPGEKCLEEQVNAGREV
jgi:hypothetical protein